MRQCPKCKAILREGANFCSQCGKPLKSSSSINSGLIVLICLNAVTLGAILGGLLLLINNNARKLQHTTAPATTQQPMQQYLQQADAVQEPMQQYPQQTYTVQQPIQQHPQQTGTEQEAVSSITFWDAERMLSDRLELNPTLHLTEAQRQWRERQFKNYLYGKFVEWEGILVDVYPSGTLSIKCNPQTATSDVKLQLRNPDPQTLINLPKGARIKFRGRILEHSIFGWTLTDGWIVAVY